jgi:hypothetical protein
MPQHCGTTATPPVEPRPPVADLDTGDVTVVPGFTGQLLNRFDPDATARGDEQVYRSMISALPEASPPVTTPSRQDKPTLAVTRRRRGSGAARM